MKIESDHTNAAKNNERAKEPRPELQSQCRMRDGE